MSRALLIAACLTLLACEKSRAEVWTRLELHRNERFEISLSAGGTGMCNVERTNDGSTFHAT